MFIAFHVSLYLAATLVPGAQTTEAQLRAMAMLGPSLLILLLGTADDLRSVRPSMKIGVQLVAGLFVYYQLGIRIDMLTNPFTGTSTLAFLSLPATLFWIVLVTNAFNIVDGMDGLAAGVCFIALICMFLVSLQMGNTAIALVVAPLAGAVLGFLKYNFSPATIFLGDSGSLFLGFQLAVLSMVGSQKSSTAIAVTAPLFILALPLVETAISTVRRFLSGRSIVRADSGHIHHRLTRLGFTPRRAVGMLYIGSAIFGLASLFVIRSNATVVGLIALFLAAVTWIAIQRLGYSEFAELNSALKRFVNQRRIIQNSIVSRKLADDLRLIHSPDEAWPLLKKAARQLAFSNLEFRIWPLNDGREISEEPTSYSQRLAVAADEVGDETSFSVALMAGGRELGEVVFSRPTAAAPLHSELPLLISAVAQGLPPLLQQTSVAAAISEDFAALDRGTAKLTMTPANEPVPSPSPQLSVSCPVCAANRLARSRSRSGIERARKRLTQKRVHQCAGCGWRGWIIPGALSHVDPPVLNDGPSPNLYAIDDAIAAVHFEPRADIGSMMGQIAFRQAERPISPGQAPHTQR